MATTQHERVKQIFLQACEVEPAARAEFLDRLCDGNGDLREDVESLLAAHDAGSADDFLKTPIIRVEDLIEEEENLLEIPDRIGGYEIIRLIGSGGMSSVFEARQQYPERTVAIKVMKQGFTSPSLVRRFEYEVQVLARLRHPYIAQVFDAGTYEGQNARVPYFVMEYVHDARPITRYAWERELSINERVRLFTRVCDAVAYGHTRGVIHRDLKPANILVDANGVPKIIDFGVARATKPDPDLADTMKTRVGQIVGTPQYMSPEQFEGDPEDVDTRSDVYSLGMVLYELLCGKVPYNVRDQTIVAAAKIVRERVPRRAGSVVKSLRGDLETILARTLEKNRTKRYASAAGFGLDLRAYLERRPIAARAPSTVYRARMFIRRNAAWVGAGLAVFWALVIGVAITSYHASNASIAQQEARRETLRALEAESAAREAEAQARREADQLRAVTQFLRQMLGAVDRADSDPAGPPTAATDLTVDQLIQRALPRIEEAFQGKPLLEAQVREMIGLTLRGLGRFDQSLEQFQQALKLRLDTPEANDRQTLRLRMLIGHNLAWLLRHAEAEATYRQTLPLLQQTFGHEHPLTYRCMYSLADALQWQMKFDESEQWFSKVIEHQRAALGPTHPDTIHTMVGRATLAWNRGHYEEALKLAEEARSLSRKHRGPDDHVTLQADKLHAQVLGELGRYTQAEQALMDVRDHYLRLYGRDHPWVDGVEAELAWVIGQSGRWKQCRQMLEATLARQQQALGPTHAYTRETMRYLGFTLINLNEYDKAKQLAKALTELNTKLLGREHVQTLLAKGTLGAATYLGGDAEAGEAILAEDLEDARGVLREDHPHLALGRFHLGACQLKLGKFAEAERHLLDALRTLKATRGSDHRFVDLTRQTLAKLYTAWGKPEKGKPYQQTQADTTDGD